jgi:hypothetical protein
MVVNLDGSGVRSLSSGGYRDWSPNWGPAGIVFSSNRERSDTWKLWLVQPDGSGLRKLADVEGDEPVWTSDNRVLFSNAHVPSSRALSSISILDPASGVWQVIVDVQGKLTPIALRPGKGSHRINPASNGRIQVAILSTKSLDAAKDINASSLTFGRTGAEASLASCSKARDVNGDGLPDLLCRFSLRFTGFQPSSNVAVLRFLDKKGLAYEGRTPVSIGTGDDPDDFRD